MIVWKSNLPARTKITIIIQLAIIILFVGESFSAVITTSSLIEDMIDMRRLAEYPRPGFKNVQYSSYDRRSSVPGAKFWNANSDGFGGEPIPGFEKVLKEADKDGNGEYLVCDIKGPGAIVRTWTAGIDGTIRMYLDDSDEPAYDGSAHEFMAENFKTFAMDAKLDVELLRSCFDQQDACYLPIPFAKGCRVIWKGNIRGVHFYEVQTLQYEPSAKIRTFSAEELKKAEGSIQKVAEVFADINQNFPYPKTAKQNGFSVALQPDEKMQVLQLDGSRIVEKFSLKLSAEDMYAALRQTILYIRCDDYNIAQVSSPAGDFFGVAPGINPYDSVPFTVEPDGRMTSRYVMPFGEKMVIEFKNFGEQEVKIEGSVLHSDYEWDDSKSMHFFAHWRVKHDITTNDPGIPDLPFIIARGKGRYVGTTAMLLNPNNLPSSWGNWWGEGDEKIFVDDDIRPAIFGTGSEDYFNYSWSIGDIFIHPYCGQPRNDGPANRGFVTNYRWHIMDSIPFEHSLFFSIELNTHQRTEGISYARIGYYYGMSGTIDDHVYITREDVRKPVLPSYWMPGIGFGSQNSVFFQAEEITEDAGNFSIVSDGLWAGGKMLAFNPVDDKQKLNLHFPVTEGGSYTIHLVTARTPDSGTIICELDGKIMKLADKEEYDLSVPYRTLSKAVSGPEVILSKGTHTLTIRKGPNCSQDSMLGLDFLWLQKR